MSVFRENTLSEEIEQKCVYFLCVCFLRLLYFAGTRTRQKIMSEQKEAFQSLGRFVLPSLKLKLKHQFILLGDIQRVIAPSN
jgi:hypothetical protein